MPSSGATRVVAYYPLPTGGANAPFLEQKRLAAEFARAKGLVVVEPFVESRRGRNHPELERALERCREVRAALLVPSLAAIGGDLRFLDAVLAARVSLLAADVGRTPLPSLRLLREVARHTQSEASDRSRAALRRARARGVALGSPRPEIGSRAGVAALRARAEAHAQATAPVLAELLLSNPTASLRDLAQLLEALGVPTPRRGRWGPSAVRNTIERAGLSALRRSAERARA
jgi:DNA invertase Pin-like site-specific DNA recombinase